MIGKIRGHRRKLLQTAAKQISAISRPTNHTSKNVCCEYKPSWLQTSAYPSPQVTLSARQCPDVGITSPANIHLTKMNHNLCIWMHCPLLSRRVRQFAWWWQTKLVSVFRLCTSFIPTIKGAQKRHWNFLSFHKDDIVTQPKLLLQSARKFAKNECH